MECVLRNIVVALLKDEVLKGQTIADVTGKGMWPMSRICSSI